MFRLFATLITFVATFTLANAQTFMEHLTSKVSGQGTVTVLQDPRLEALVNGTKNASASKEEKTPAIPSGRKVKARGYRIQVYWGGSSSTDHTNAQRMGNRVTAAFPELQAYTTYKSPNWVCRVGDFATHNDAQAYVRKLKDAKITRDAIVVNSEVIIYKNQ